MSLRPFCDECGKEGEGRRYWLPSPAISWGCEIFLTKEGKRAEAQDLCPNCFADTLLRTFRAQKGTPALEAYDELLRNVALLPKVNQSLGEVRAEREEIRSKLDLTAKNAATKASAFDEEKKTYEQRALEAANALAELKAKLAAAIADRDNQSQLAGRVRLDEAAVAATISAAEQRAEAERRKAKDLERQLADAHAKLTDGERKRQDLLEAAQRSANDIEASAATRITQARRIKEVETALADANGRIQNYEKFKQAVEQQAQKNSVDAAASTAERDQAHQRVLVAQADRKRAEDALQAVEQEKSRLVVAVAALEKRASNAETAATLATTKLREAAAASKPATPIPPSLKPLVMVNDGRLGAIQELADRLNERLLAEQAQSESLKKELLAAKEAVTGAAWAKDREQLLAQLKAATEAQALADVKAQNAVRDVDERIRRAEAAARQAAVEDPHYLEAIRKREVRRST
jgi:hypothetical protein